jgi:adenylate cyclase
MAPPLNPLSGVGHRAPLTGSGLGAVRRLGREGRDYAAVWGTWVHTGSMSEAGDRAFFEELETHRIRGVIRLMRHLPSDPRCAICRAPYGGLGGRIMGRFGFAPSRKNPRLCSTCFEKAPMGGVEMQVGILFADVRGFTALAERQAPDDVAALLNRFYASAVEVLCEHAIIDKLVGDQVMALYLPGVFPGEPASHMVTDARALLAAAGYGESRPWVDLGVGLDFGDAFVGNVGAGDVKDFTAIGDVVNTAARLQAAAASGEILISSRVEGRASEQLAGAEERRLSLKGKSEPETVLVTGVGG